MPKAAAERVREIISLGEFRLRLTIATLFNKQRKELPVREIISLKYTPIELTDTWEEEFIEWFVSRREFWRNLWNKSIPRRVEIKLTTQEAFDDFIEQRSLFIGLELAAVNAKAIDNVIRLHSVGSVQRLDRGLREVIGLRPDQFNAFTKEARLIDKRFPNNPAKAKAIKDRIYNKKINYRAQLIARTEMSNGINTAQMADMNARIERGDLPQAMEKRWSTVGDDRVSAKCQDNENDGWIYIKDAFTSGHERPPRFPGCRCGLQFRARREAA